MAGNKRGNKRQRDDDAPHNKEDDNDHAEKEEEEDKKDADKKEDEEEDDGIDHWAPLKITGEDVHIDKGPLMLEESSFATLFPQYREKYLQQVWPEVTKGLKAHHIDCQLDLVEGSMSVRTTRKTFDPFVIFKARDVIKLLARSVPYQQALRVLGDDKVCDIIKIRSLVRNQDKFTKRRQRLLGPKGQTLKAIELLTESYVLVQGSTVCCVGDFKGIKLVRQIVEDCMRNVHPVYHIKELMIKRELAKDAKLAHESWERFLPHFKKRNVKRKAPKTVKDKPEYTPFPPAQTPRKEDLAIESGEFFLSPREKSARALHDLAEKQATAVATKQDTRQQQYVAPKEDKQKRKSKGAKKNEPSVADLANKLKQAAPAPAAVHAPSKQPPSTAQFVVGGKKAKRRKVA